MQHCKYRHQKECNCSHHADAVHFAKDSLAGIRAALAGHANIKLDCLVCLWGTQHAQQAQNKELMSVLKS
jgi:hypothetical protein